MYGSCCSPCLTRLQGLGRLTWHALHPWNSCPSAPTPPGFCQLEAPAKDRSAAGGQRPSIRLASSLPARPQLAGAVLSWSSTKATVCLSSSSLQAPIIRSFLVLQRPWHGQCSSSLQPSPSFLGFPNPAYTLVVSPLIQSSSTTLFGCAVSQGILIAEHIYIRLLHSHDPRSSNSDSNCIVVPGLLRGEMCASEKALYLLRTYLAPND